MEDLLTQIWNKQKAYSDMVLSLKLGSNGGWSVYPVDGPLDQKVHMLCTAIMHETMELDKLTNYKWWKNPKPFDKCAAKEELIDIFHFVIHGFIELGMTPQDILNEYMKKNDVNVKRQANNY